MIRIVSFAEAIALLRESLRRRFFPFGSALGPSIMAQP